MKDRNDDIEETESLEQRQSRERACKVEKGRIRKPDERQDLDPSPNQRTVQPSARTRRSG